MTKDDREIVSALRASLADRVGKDRYEVWFGPSTQLLVRGGTLTVGVPNRFFQDWLRSNFRKEIEASCIDALGESLALEFRVESSIRSVTTATPEAASAAISEAPRSTPLHVANASRVAQESSSCESASERRHFASLSTFVVGESNCLAYKSAQLALDHSGQLSPLFLHGPTGVGKTHLMEGIWAAFKKKHKHGRAIYLSAEQFTSYFLEALHGSGLPSFRRKYRDLELLLIDDVQFFANKRATLTELLHTIDPLLRAGRQLVLAADRSPAALKSLGPELAARLAGGMVSRIEPPEYPTRLGIVEQLASTLHTFVPKDVQGYIASHLTSHARELAGALKRLQATSLAHSRPITLALAEEALADLIHHTGRAVCLPDIEKAVCDVFGLQSDSLQSSRKGKTVSHPRMLAMWLARKHTRAALSEIGHYFGRRSHSTVIAAQKKIETWMASGTALSLTEHPWKLEDAIRRVEEYLRAG